MDIIEQAERIFGVKAQPMSLMEQKIQKMVGDNVLIYQVNWKTRKVKILAMKKRPY